MERNFRGLSCKDCWFREETVCRRFPPQKMNHSDHCGPYPVVAHRYGLREDCIDYQEACAEFSVKNPPYGMANE